jgi:plasmid maintenance system antidote protein VapI
MSGDGFASPYSSPPDFAAKPLLELMRGLTPTTALRLAKYFGVSPGFWLNLQIKCDLQAAEKRESAVLQAIKPKSRNNSPATVPEFI